jgi:hypothetical protein
LELIHIAEIKGSCNFFAYSRALRYLQDYAREKQIVEVITVVEIPALKIFLDEGFKLQNQM